jgi:amino-acid N-acetyltransferase
MQIRDPKIQDVPKIHELINSFAEMDRMLFASMARIYENLQIFKVAEVDGVVVGCCALKVLWKDLAEVKSLAVDKSYAGRGFGRALVTACVDKARVLGLKKVFTLTLEPEFFEKVGFKRVEKDTLPMKVWSDCTECPKQDHCDEIALECIL